MDFQNTQPQVVTQDVRTTPTSTNSNAKSTDKSPAKNTDKNKFSLITNVSLFGGVIVLLVALVAFIGLGSPVKESKYINTSKYQAVFLQTGQVYFGKLKISDGSYVLSDIYYLQSASTGTTSTTSSNVSLVKLGCELHQPYDQMIINHSQITFWENLQDNGQVAKAVATFVKNNPNGQKCADQTSSTTTNSSLQNAATTKQ